MYERRALTLAGGVASRIRFSQLPVPLTVAEASGAYLVDADGNRYLDLALAYGPALLGHSPTPVLEAVRRQLEKGFTYGASHLLEAELSEAIVRTVPSAEMCTFSSSGSEAALTALRIARSATGRNRVIKFEGHFHGWPDPLAVGTPGHAGGEPTSSGQDPQAFLATSVCQWNDIEALKEMMSDDVAAVIMEPVACNGGAFEPAPGYLAAASDLITRSGAVLIFDEVITGYRLALGGAQERYGVQPDLTILGKALGAGFPISAVVGRSAVMEEAASGRVVHLGTFNANPVCAAAALAAVNTYEDNASDIYPSLDRAGSSLAEIFRQEASSAGLPLVVNQIGATGYALWSSTPVRNHGDLIGSNHEKYRILAKALLDEGILVIPRGLLYVSTCHGDAELALAREAIGRAIRRVAQTPAVE